jgi:hypothetical protein
MPSQLPNIDVASAAGAYATFGFLLVGFAFTGLFYYLTQRRKQEDRPSAPAPASAQGKLPPPDLIETRHVTVAVLYAMASLLLTSLLYIELASQAAPSGPSAASPPWTLAALVPYGVAFSLSVLMLFYGLTLIMVEQSSPVASWSYWVVACVGPAVALRFLLAAGAQARAVTCRCTPGWPLSRWGIAAMVVLAAGVAAFFMLKGLDWPVGRGLLKRLMNRPAAPSILVFVGVAVMAGLLSVYFSGRGPHYRASSVVMPYVWIGVGAVFLFALFCGCVIGPRVYVSRPARGRRREEEKKEFARRYLPSLAVPTGTAPSGTPAPGGWPVGAALGPWTMVEPDTGAGGTPLAGPYQGSAPDADLRAALITRANEACQAGQDGDYTVARDRCLALLPDFEGQFGPEHPKTLTVRANHAHWVGLAGDAAAARDLLAGLLPIRERVLGRGHPETVAARQARDFWAQRAGALFRGGDHSQAVAMWPGGAGREGWEGDIPDPRRHAQRHGRAARCVPQVVAVQRGRPAEPAGASRGPRILRCPGR